MELIPDGWYARMEDAMLLSITFVFARPKNHFRTNGQLKPSAPKYCISRIGDVDKLSRAVLDGLTGICFHDDAAVISLIANRRYATATESPCAIITVTAVS